MSTSKPRCSKNQVRWQYAGIASDHGKRRSSCSSVEVSPSFGSSCKRNSRYPNGSSPLRLAVSIILKHNALAYGKSGVARISALTVHYDAVCFSRRRFWNPESSEPPAGIQTRLPREGRYRAILEEWQKPLLRSAAGCQPLTADVPITDPS